MIKYKHQETLIYQGTMNFSEERFPGGNLQAAWYCSSTAEGFAVLEWYWHKHGLPPAQLRNVTWSEVAHQYCCGTGHRYHASTEICTGSVLALLQSRLLTDT